MEAMMTTLAILGLAALYVLLPVAVRAYRHARGPRRVVCPQTLAETTIEVDPGHAALGAATGSPDLRIRRCGEWPAHGDCRQGCRAQVDLEAARAA
jgi:hypothetical protein